MELLTQFDVYKTNKNFVYFVELNAKDKNSKIRDKVEEAKYILMKEFMDGYSYFDKYQLKQGKEKIDITIAHEYKIDDITIPHNYTLALRKAMFGANQ
jgi:hypothetical protein